MRRLANPRLVAQIQRMTESGAYSEEMLYYPVPPKDSPVDAYGRPTSVPAAVIGPCSFTDKPHLELWKEVADVASIVAEVRFAYTVPTSGGQIELTQYFGDVNYVGVRYEIVDLRDRGPFGYLCALKKAAV